MKKRKEKKKIKQIKLAAAAIGACLALAGCSGAKENGTAGYEQITQEEAKGLMTENDDAIILDVRTQEEYDSGHIPGAVCIPNETIDDTVAEQLPDKEQLILVYCRSGNRSKQASAKLAEAGYTNVKEFGGINTWPYEVE